MAPAWSTRLVCNEEQQFEKKSGSGKKQNWLQELNWLQVWGYGRTTPFPVRGEGGRELIWCLWCQQTGPAAVVIQVHFYDVVFLHTTTSTINSLLEQKVVLHFLGPTLHRAEWNWRKCDSNVWQYQFRIQHQVPSILPPSLIWQLH